MSTRRRRRRPRRAPEVPVPVLENDVAHLTETVKKHIEETAAFRAEVRKEIDAINLLLSRYKGALGLLALIGSAVVAGVSVLAPYLYRS